MNSCVCVFVDLAVSILLPGVFVLMRTLRVIPILKRGGVISSECVLFLILFPSPLLSTGKDIFGEDADGLMSGGVDSDEDGWFSFRVSFPRDV